MTEDDSVNDKTINCKFILIDMITDCYNIIF